MDVEGERGVMANDLKLDDCLRLLRAESDEQKIVGLLLATKFVKGDDVNAVSQIFEATGFHFINRLLKTGSSLGDGGHGKRQSYRHLALSILAAFCRLPDLAVSEEIVRKVPIFLAVLSNNLSDAVTADCCECLLAIATSSEKGTQALIELNIFGVLTHRIHTSTPDAEWIRVAVRLFDFLLRRVVVDEKVQEHVEDLILAVSAMSLQVSFRQDMTKFEALAVLYTLLASEVLMFMKSALAKSARNFQWPAHARTGLGQILHSRVAVEQKYLALETAEAIVEVVGESWLIGTIDIPERQEEVSPHRFFILVMETLRVEAAVLLNEAAQTSFDGRQANAEASHAAQIASRRESRLMKCFALLEHLINVMSNQEESLKTLADMTLNEGMIAMDEVVGLTFDFLADAQEHNERKGDIILACVRLIGRYLAEVPNAYQERCRNLLQYMVSVTETSDSRPYLAFQFLLPYLTQMTLDQSGCKSLLASRCHVQIANFLSWAVHMSHETKSAIIDACDTLLNLLAKDPHQLIDQRNVEELIPVLPSLFFWVGQGGVTKMERAMAASVSTCILALTDEKHLKSIEIISAGALQRIFSVIISCFEFYVEEQEAGGDDLEDLLDIIISGSMTCLDCYPSFTMAVRTWFQQLVGNRALSKVRGKAGSPSLRRLVQKALGN